MSKKVMQKIVSINKQTKLSAEKVELGIVDDLNKVLNSSQGLEKEIKKINDLIGTNRKYMIEAFREGNKLKKVQEKATDRRNKAEREFINAKDDLKTVNIDYNSAISREKQFDKAADSLIKKRKPLIKEATKNISSFNKMIDQAEKAAKDLGVKIPTASFSKMRDRLEKLIKVL
jgi:uncharacterized phage infection (PIP) family protein YhgE